MAEESFVVKSVQGDFMSQKIGIQKGNSPISSIHPTRAAVSESLAKDCYTIPSLGEVGEPKTAQEKEDGEIDPVVGLDFN